MGSILAVEEAAEQDPVELDNGILNIVPEENIAPDIPQEETKDIPSESKRIRAIQLENKIVEEMTRAIEQERQNMQNEEQRVKEGKGIGFKIRMSEFYRDLSRIQKLVESLRKMSQENAQEKFIILQQLRAERERLMQKKKEGYYLKCSREDDSQLQTELFSFKIQKKEEESSPIHERKEGNVLQEKEDESEEVVKREEGPTKEEKEESSLDSVRSSTLELKRNSNVEQKLKKLLTTESLENPNIPKIEDATQELDNGFNWKNHDTSVPNNLVYRSPPLLAVESRRNRVVLNNWSNPLRRFLEEQKKL